MGKCKMGRLGQGSIKGKRGGGRAQDGTGRIKVGKGKS